MPDEGLEQEKDECRLPRTAQRTRVPRPPKGTEGGKDVEINFAKLSLDLGLGQRKLKMRMEKGKIFLLALPA